MEGNRVSGCQNSVRTEFRGASRYALARRRMLALFERERLHRAEPRAEVAADAGLVFAAQVEPDHVERAGRANRHAAGAVDARRLIDLDVIAPGAGRRRHRHHHSILVALTTSFGCSVKAILK